MANVALDADPRTAAAWALRGRAAAKAGEFDRALADFHRALALAPADRELLLDTAEIHRALGQPKQALTTLLSLSDTYAGQEEPARVLYLKGLALAALARHADAVDAYTLALARQPADAELLARLADAQLRIGQIEAAESAVAQALHFDPNHQMARAVQEQLSGLSVARLPRE
jgi:tetratricopeptide (TPR) repeat protein